MSSSPKLEKQAKVSKVGKLNSSHAKVPSAGATHSNAVTAGYRIISEGAAARCAMCVWQDITHVNCRNRRCEVDFSPPKWPTDMLHGPRQSLEQACKEGPGPGEEGLISRCEIKARSPPQAGGGSEQLRRSWRPPEPI
jgi:hypothetical protein